MEEIYLNTAATGRVESEYIKQSSKNYKHLNENPSDFAEKWFEKEIPEIKDLVADRFGAHKDQVALIPNFSFGINAVLNALPENSNVLYYDKDYPSLVDPLQHKNFNIITFNDRAGFTIFPETIERFIRKHFIDFLLISHVQWLSGFKIDLKIIASICKRNNVRIIVDATQSAGAVDINFEKSGVDVMIFSNYKWLNSGFGNGVLLMKEDFLEAFPPKISGMHSYDIIKGKMVLEPNIKFYEPGHQNLFGLSILKQVLENRSRKDIKKIAERNQKLTKLFIDNFKHSKLKILGTKNMANRSSIVYVQGGEKLHEYLSKNGVITSIRGGNVRISFHYYNKKKEVEKSLPS